MRQRLLPAAAALVAALTVAAPSRALLADTVILADGRKLEGVVVSQNDDVVVVNPWNSRCPEMTWEVPEKNRFPRDKVKEVVIEDAPVVEARRRAAERGMTLENRRELAAFCAKHGLEDEAKLHERLAKGAELRAALEESGTAPATTALPPGGKGDPGVDPELRRLEAEYVNLADPAALDAQWKLMQARFTTRSRTFLERARRSVKQPKGRRDKVPLTVRSKEAPGGTYCIFVPSSYDPLVATPLVVALHGGGRGGADQKLVTGNGEEAMNFYTDVAEEWGWIVVCPSALQAGWENKANEPLLDGLLEEMKLLFDVDETRIYLTGHSMGGFGTWSWGPQRADVWAAIAPCAGGGGANGVEGLGLPTYIYHGSDDNIVGPDSDRSAAKTLLAGKKKADAVYTEIGGVGHGFPDWVRKDIFRFFAGRQKDKGKKRSVEPASSFLRKVEKEEVRSFGDPSAPLAGAGADDAGDAKLADLVAKLERGGGAAVEAVAELEKRKDAATAKAVGRVLRSKKATPDVRAAAAKALGGIGGADAVAALAAETANEDFRVVDEVVVALGKIGGQPTLDPLLRAAKQMGAFYDASMMGTAVNFTEYEVRCRSFGRLCTALAATGVPAGGAPRTGARPAGPAEPAAEAIEKEVVGRVFLPKTPYTVAGSEDARFTHIPPRARLDLAKEVRAALEKLEASHRTEVLARVRDAWKREAALVQALE